jgi:hypothetical protein
MGLHADEVLDGLFAGSVWRRSSICRRAARG